jgi:very-short-patch-repair endonuclease
LTQIFNKSEFTDMRRTLRNNMSPPEHVLWSRLRGKQIDGLKFRRQYGIGRYVVDFYCVEIRLVVELDGTSHCSEEVWQKDMERQHYLESLDQTVLRFTNSDLNSRPDGVVEQIATIAEELRSQTRTQVRSKVTSPQPPPS